MVFAHPSRDARRYSNFVLAAIATVGGGCKEPVGRGGSRRICTRKQVGSAALTRTERSSPLAPFEHVATFPARSHPRRVGPIRVPAGRVPSRRARRADGVR